MTFQWNSRIALSAGAVVITAAALSLNGLAQVATQQQGGRTGGTGGSTTGTTQQTTGRGATQGQGQTQTPSRDTSAQTQQTQNTAVISGLVVMEGAGTPADRRSRTIRDSSASRRSRPDATR
jgi:hypothetical protein